MCTFEHGCRPGKRSASSWKNATKNFNYQFWSILLKSFSDLKQLQHILLQQKMHSAYKHVNKTNDHWLQMNLSPNAKQFMYLTYSVIYNWLDKQPASVSIKFKATYAQQKVFRIKKYISPSSYTLRLTYWGLITGCSVSVMVWRIGNISAISASLAVIKIYMPITKYFSAYVTM